MNKWITTLWVIIAIIFSVLFWNDTISAADKIQEPPLSEVIQWKPDQSLGLLLKYHIDGEDIIFAHPVKSQGGYPQCQELQSDKQLNEIRVVLGGPNPWLYIVTGEATMYRRDYEVVWTPSNIKKIKWLQPYLLVKE